MAKFKRIKGKWVEVTKPPKIMPKARPGIISGSQQQAKRLTPRLKVTTAEAANKVGMAIFERGEYEKAVWYFEKVIKLDPKFPNAWYNLGKAYYKIGKSEDALKCFRKVPENASKVGWAWYFTAEILRGKGKFEEAIAYYDRVLKKFPKDAASWMHKGECLHALGKSAEANECYDEAVKLNPKFKEARAQAQVIAALDKVTPKKIGSISPFGIITPPPSEDDKVFAQEKAKGKKQKVAEELNKKGLELAAANKYGEAEKLFVKAIKLKTGWIVPLYNMGEVMRNNKAFTNAIEYYDKVLEINPRHAGALNGKGMCLIELRKIAEGLAFFEKAIEIIPEWTQPRYNIGDHYLNLGRYHESIKWFENVLIINPKDEWALLGKGISILGRYSPLDFAEKKKAAEEALTFFEKALYINPKLTEARFYKGIALIRILGKKEGAIAAFKRGAELLKKAGKLYPMDTNIVNLSAAELRIAKDYEGAKNELQDLDTEEFMSRIIEGRTGKELEPLDMEVEDDIAKLVKLSVETSFFTDGKIKIKCPACANIMDISDTKRPLELRCTSCNTILLLEKTIGRLRCPKCGTSIDIIGTKRPLEIRCGKCNMRLVLRK